MGMGVGIGLGVGIGGSAPAASAPAVEGFGGTIFYASGQWWHSFVWGAIPGASFEIERYADFGGGSTWSLVTEVSDASSCEVGYASSQVEPFRIRVTVDGVPGPWSSIPGIPSGLTVSTTGTVEISLTSGEASPAPGGAIASVSVDCDNATGVPFIAENGPSSFVDCEFTVFDPTVDQIVEGWATDSEGLESLHLQLRVPKAPQSANGSYYPGTGETSFSFGSGDSVDGVKVFLVSTGEQAEDGGPGSAGSPPFVVSADYGGVDVFLRFSTPTDSPGLRSSTFTVQIAV